MADLIQIVTFIAKCARHRSESGQTENSNDYFWSTTSLAGLTLLRGKEREAFDLLADACASQRATLFQKMMLKLRLELLRELNFKADFARSAIDRIDRFVEKKKAFKNVVLFHSDVNVAAELWSSAAQTEIIRQQMAARLASWKIGAGDLAICASKREGDILFAELCRSLNADVRLLVLGSDASSGKSCWGSNDWAARCLGELNAEIWSHERALGEPLNLQVGRETHNRWVLNTARMEAYALKDSRLFGLTLWNGQGLPPESDDPQSPGYLSAGVRSYRQYGGWVDAIQAMKSGESPRTATAV